VRGRARHAVVSVLLAAALGLALPAPSSAQEQPLPCPDCNPPKRFWAGAGELMVVQAIPWAWTKWVTEGEWSNISPRTWGDNLKFAWQWDNNKFNNNQFAHPYHGSLYFNAGRANGYDFWHSVPWAFGGSLMWELFGEVWAPAPNDLANTTLGGISLGEMLFRFSSLVLKNEATGRNRMVREVSAALINPVRGFNRLVRGEMNDISQTPPDWRPSTIQATMDVGYRHLSTSTLTSDSLKLDQGFVRFNVFYGNQVEDLGKKPFSAFQVTGMLASRSGNHKPLQELNVRGNLAGRPLGSNGSGSQLALFMTYEYLSNPVVDFGAQGFQGGIITLKQPSDNVRLYGEALLRANPIAAIRSDYFVTAEGRDYDYGIGLGGALRGTALWEGRGLLRVGGGFTWLPVVSGFAGNHYLWTLTTEGRGYLQGKYGIGVVYNRLWRRSRYTFNPDVDENVGEFRVFLSLAIPGWEQ
jgi:Domain of unknown function (DUF3943)